MKNLILNLPVLACLLSLGVLAQGSNVPTGNGSENCLNKSQTPECEPCEESCGTQDGVEDETNSFVHTGMLDYHSWSYDFKLPGTDGGCSPCGSNTGINTSLHSVMVKRYSRTRTRNTSIHSFGRVSTLAGYDVNFQWAENSIEKFVDFIDSGKYNAQTTLKWNSSRQTWAPRFAVDAAFGLTLYDSTGNPLTAYWNRDLSHTGVFLRADGGTIHFEIIRKGDYAYGRPTAFADRNGNITTVEYIDAQPPYGTSVTTVSEYFRRTKITDPYGRELNFEYSLEGNEYLVSKITHPDGQFTTYDYATWSFYGKAISQVNHPDGSVSTSTRTLDPTSGHWKWTKFEATAPVGKRRGTAYISHTSAPDDNGVTISTQTGLTRLVLNADNEITHANRTDSSGQRIVFAGGNKAYGVTMTNGTKGLGSYKEITTGSSLQNNFFTVDLSTLNQVERFSRVNNSSSWREISKTDAFSRLKSTPTRDSINLKPTQIDYADGTQRVTTYNPFETPLSHTDRLDRLTQCTFDSFGNKLSQTRGVGSPEASTQTWLYNAQGLVIEHRDALYDPAFPELHNTQYEYDANNYPTKKIHAADIAGGTRPETLYSWDSTGRLASTTDPLGRTVTYTYDNRSRLIQTTYNDTSAELVEYGTGADANLIVKTTDRNGIETTYSYDASDRVTSTELRDPSLPLADPALRTATYTYLNGTNLKQTSTIDGNTTETLFDHQNRVIGTKTYPDTNNTLETSSEIDVLSRTRSTTDAYGRKTYYLYDQNDRITRVVTETIPNGLPSVPAFDNTSSQTSSQKNYTFTDKANNTLETDPNNDGYTHEVTYTDARDLHLQNLTRDLSTNAAYLITDDIYDAEGQLLVTTNAKGIITWMEYDQLGRNTLTINALGTPDETRSENIYDDQSNLVEVRHPRYFSESINHQDQYTYNGRNLKSSHTIAPSTPEAATQSWIYLADARLDQHTDYRGNIMTYLWHVCCGRLQATVDRDGQATTIFNTDYAGRSTHTATVTTNPGGNWHDPINANTLQEITTRYDGRGRPTFTTRWLVAQGNIVDHARASLSNGVIPIAGQNGIPATEGLTTSYVYDEDLTDGLGLDVAYSAQLANLPITLGPNATGSAIEMTNPAGEKSVQILDGLGRTIMSINPEGDYATMSYDVISTPQADGAQAPLAATPIPGDLLKTSSTDANGNTSSSYSDGAGRTLATTDAINNASYAGYNAANSRISFRDSNGLGEDCTLDALEREVSCSDLQEQAEATSRTTTYNTASQPVSNTDAESNTSSMVYDVRGRLESTTDANNITVSYFYDANNNLTALIDGNGNQRTWTYDARNLNTAKTYPGGGGDTCLYTHDALRRIVDKTDQSNTIHRHNYDLASRLTSKEYLTGGTTLESTDTFTYDAASRITSTNKGRHAISTTHTYALDSMPLSQTITADGRSYTMSRSYDAGNRVISHTYPDNKAATWNYDTRNLVTSVSYDGESVITKTHDAGYRLTNSTYGNGLTRTISYTRQDNLITSDTTFDGMTALADLNLSYTYAADKQITAENIAAGGVLPNNASFTANYDPGNRLTSWTRAGYPTGSGVTARQSQSWNFDDAGNWTSTILDGTTQNRSHNVKDQTTVLDGNATTHDARGNLLTFEHNSQDYTISYDLENRITQVDVDNDDVEYRYDAFGRRIIRKEGSDETALLWWGSSECAEYEHTATQPTIQNDIFCDPNRLNTVVARAVDGSKFDIEYYHKNYLDHVYAVSDDNGNLIEHYRYTAYGEQEVYNATGTLITTSAIGNEITWNTRRTDTITGFYMYQFRHYAPQLGKWPSRDPIGERGGLNLYAFVENDSLNYRDVLGMLPFMDVDECIERCPSKRFKSRECVKECRELCAGYDKYYDDDKTNDPCDPGGNITWIDMTQEKNGRVRYGYKLTGVDPKCCSEIGLLQYFVFEGAGPDQETLRLDTGDWRGSHMSPQPPYYDNTNPISTRGKHRGSGGMIVTDRPSAVGKFHFLLFAICAKGPAKGYIFGAFVWSITIKGKLLDRQYGKPKGVEVDAGEIISLITEQ